MLTGSNYYIVPPGLKSQLEAVRACGVMRCAVGYGWLLRLRGCKVGVGWSDEATLTVVRLFLPMEAAAETQPREKEKKVLFYPVVICSRLARVPINMQIGNTHPRNSDRFFFLRRIIELHVGI